MSKYSVDKPNPTKERTLAHGIAKERQENLIIPLNLGLKPTELPWMSSDLTFVDFSVNWAEGLAIYISYVSLQLRPVRHRRPFLTTATPLATTLRGMLRMSGSGLELDLELIGTRKRAHCTRATRSMMV